MRLSLNQRGVFNALLPLVLLVAIGLGVYLVQQQTELTPSAQEFNPPTGCRKVTPGTRSVKYKNCQSASEACGDETRLVASDGERDVDPNFQFDGKTVASYPLKESVWDFGGWKLYGTKGPRQSDGDRTDVSVGRFDGPNGKSYEEVDADPYGSNREAYKIVYREKGGQSTIVEIAYTKSGTNYQGLPGTTYDKSKSYAIVPENAGTTTKCDGAGATGTKNTGASCSNGNECKSGSCTNQKCDATGTKAGGAACTNGSECQSGQCSNQKCSGGSRSTGSACDQNSQCASNKCEANKCVSATTSPSPRASGSATPRPSGSGSAASPAPGSSPAASPSPSASAGASPSPAASTSPAPSGSPTGSPVPISLTKAEITGFRSSYGALEARLGSASNSGNLKVVATIARSELDSIVSQLPTCPDDANVGTCLDQKFRTRFDFAKTAARLSAFYAIFNNVSGICVKSDFGLQPLITATSANGNSGRVNLCTEPTASQKIWRVFFGGRFEQVAATDTRWPANPTCPSLPQDVMTHYRNAEKLFDTQPNFTQNTACDGVTSFEAPGSP